MFARIDDDVIKPTVVYVYFSSTRKTLSWHLVLLKSVIFNTALTFQWIEIIDFDKISQTKGFNQKHTTNTNIKHLIRPTEHWLWSMHIHFRHLNGTSVVGLYIKLVTQTTLANQTPSERNTNSEKIVLEHLAMFSMYFAAVCFSCWRKAASSLVRATIRWASPESYQRKKTPANAQRQSTFYVSRDFLLARARVFFVSRALVL